MGKVGWTDRVRNEVLRDVKENRNILITIKEEMMTGLVTTYRLLQCVIEGNVERILEVTGILE